MKLINKKNKKVIDYILSIHFGFLERLEKYGTSKNLNYQKLENKIINNIQDILNKNNDINKNQLFLIDNKIKIIEIKLIKYSKEELDKIKIIFKEFENNLFTSENNNYFNYISFHFIKFFINEQEQNENNNNEIYLEEIIKLVKPKINIEKLNKEILLYNNIKFLMLISSNEYLISNLLTKENFELNKKIIDFLILSFSHNDLASLKDIFTIINNIKNEIEFLIEKITQIQICYKENDENCFNFLKYYIGKFKEIISDEMTYYIKPELMKNYFEMIINQFEKGKVNYIILKELYYKLIELIVDKSIQINENDKNEDGKKYYEEAYKFVKKKMKKFLINGKAIKEEILKKKENNNKNNYNFFNWIE